MKEKLKPFILPSFDAEKEKLRLEWWLYHTWNGKSPIEVLWKEQRRSVPL